MKGKPKENISFHCKICNQEVSIKAVYIHLKSHQLTSKEYYDTYCKKENEGICSCGKETVYQDVLHGYRKYCSTSCLNKSKEHIDKTKQTLINKHGQDNPSKIKEFQDKRTQTNKERFGFDNVFQNESIQEKSKNSLINKWGTDNISKLQSIKLRKILTCQTNYGVDYPSQSEIIKKQFSNTRFNDSKDKYEKWWTDIIKKYEPLITLEEAYYNYQTGKFRCNTCKTEFTVKINWNKQNICPICDKTKSYLEQEFLAFIQELDIKNISVNNRSEISPLELDVYLPDYKIAFELHGLWWHSSCSIFHKYKHDVLHNLPDIYDESRKLSQYHYRKYWMCKNKNIRLIQIFEDEWRDNQEICKSRIKYMLNKIDPIKKISARNCEVKEIDFITSMNFLMNNHIQGSDKTSIRLGLYNKDNELVSLMTFGKPNKAKGGTKNNGYELSRFCSKKDYVVIGGSSKLFSYFVKNYNPETIFTYADLRWSLGNLYEQLGFKCLGETGTGYWYTDGTNRIHRFNFRKQANEPRDIPEWILRSMQGWYRIWDCGNLKYLWRNPN